MNELEGPLKVGKVVLVPAADPVGDPAHLRIDLLDNGGTRCGSLSISAGDITDDAASAIALFSYQVEEERRKAQYLEQYPLAAGGHNRARIELELDEDFGDWFLRQRGDRGRFEGIDPIAVREWRCHR